MSTIRTLAAAAVVLASSLGANAAPDTEKSGTAGKTGPNRPAAARVMTADAKGANQSKAKNIQLACMPYTEWFCNVYGVCWWRTYCL